jgi:alkylated DNA nucleotide flippase Atl1
LYSESLDLPWWRVVNVQGRLVPGQENEQATLLKSEGIELINGRARLDD